MRMTEGKYLTMAVLLTAIWLSSCKTGDPGQSDSVVFEVKLTDKQADIRFDTLECNFGTVVEGERLIAYFDYTNTGEGELLIQKVEASCGCTRVDWDKKALAPGERATLSVIFESSGRRGKQYKTIRVHSNAPDPLTILSIRATVK